MGFWDVIKAFDLAAHGIDIKSNEAINKILSNKAVQEISSFAASKPVQYLTKGYDEIMNVLGYDIGKHVTEELASDLSKYGTKDYLRVGLMTYAGLNIPYRLASGGGIYRDNQGNTDIIGIPFI